MAFTPEACHGMSIDDERDETRAQEARVLAALERLATEVSQALGEDLAAFPMAEARRRFLADPEAADTVNDEAIARIKGDLEAQAPAVRDAILQSLSDLAVWVSGIDCEPATGKSFEEHPTLWHSTRPVEELVAAVLARHGFLVPADDPVRYRMPMRFIGRKYLPGLAEKYWSLIDDLRHVRSRLEELRTAEVRDSLGRRWDKA